MKNQKSKTLSDDQIDKIVIAQADDDSAWEKPIRVRKSKRTSVPVSPVLAARAAFFARLHREASTEKWIMRILEERLRFEEAAFAGLKRDLKATQKNKKNTRAQAER
ncbi:MAG: hypothetical protein ACREOO_16005 [bacterium]